MPNIEQQRAGFALECVTKITPGSAGHYVSYVSAMPAQILNNGLGQTIATLLAAAGRKGGTNDPHYVLCNHVAQWLRSKEQIFSKQKTQNWGPVELIRALMNADQQTYLEAQIEVLAFLEWLKKFARALIEEVPSIQAT